MGRSSGYAWGVERKQGLAYAGGSPQPLMLRAPVGAFPQSIRLPSRKVTDIVNMKAKTGVSDRRRVRSVIGGTNHRS